MQCLKHPASRSYACRTCPDAERSYACCTCRDVVMQNPTCFSCVLFPDTCRAKLFSAISNGCSFRAAAATSSANPPCCSCVPELS